MLESTFVIPDGPSVYPLPLEGTWRERPQDEILNLGPPVLQAIESAAGPQPCSRITVADEVSEGAPRILTSFAVTSELLRMLRAHDQCTSRERGLEE